MRYLPLLLLFAAHVAGGEDVREPEGFWTGPINSPVPATLAGGQIIHAEALASLMKRAAPVVVDVSNAPKKPTGMPADAPWLPLPHDSIAGSAWVPDAGMGQITADIDAFFREFLAQTTRNDLDHPVVIYCHERCWLSWNAAKRAVSYGYRQVYWFPEGIEGWRAAGFQTATVDAQVPSPR